MFIDVIYNDIYSTKAYLSVCVCVCVSDFQRNYKNLPSVFTFADITQTCGGGKNFTCNFLSCCILCLF